MNKPFSAHLKDHRIKAGLTNEALARRANVPESLISGLQNDNRRVGEYQAGKIGRALGLHDEELVRFVYDAIDTCTEKVLNDAKPYPAVLLNHLAMQLNHAGINAESITTVNLVDDPHKQDIQLQLNNGSLAIVTTLLVRR